MEYHAILKDWYSVKHSGVELIYGKIHSDTKNRFEDGTVVRTSPVQAFYTINGVDYVETRNTIYKLEEPTKL